MFDPLWLLAAFGGGIFGAAIGGLPNFIFCGVAAIVGAAIAFATGNGNVAGMVAWGPILGPHVGFAGGAAAAVYAARRGYITNGRDIGLPLLGLNKPDVLLVGGVFGALGYALQWLFAQGGNIGTLPWINTVALSIVVNAIIARLVFGKTGLFGKVRKGDNRWLASDVGNWLPWQSAPLQLLTLGVGYGIVVSVVTQWTNIDATHNLMGVWFGFSALILILLEFGQKVPVSHHIALAAEQAMVLGGGDIWWGVAFAVLGTYLGEVYACLFTCHADSHIDPPSVALATTFLLTAIVKQAGLFQQQGAVSMIVAVVVTVAGYGALAALKARPNAAVVPSGVKPA